MMMLIMMMVIEGCNYNEGRKCSTYTIEERDRQLPPRISSSARVPDGGATGRPVYDVRVECAHIGGGSYQSAFVEEMSLPSPL